MMPFLGISICQMNTYDHHDSFSEQFIMSAEHVIPSLGSSACQGDDDTCFGQFNLSSAT